MKRFPWYLALPAFYGAVLAVWVILFFHPSQKDDPIDVVILLMLGIGYTLAWLFMIFETDLWTLRALGVLGAVTGDSILYLILGGDHWLLRHITEGQLEGLTDLARAFFLVGMPLLIFGIGYTFWLRHGATVVAGCRRLSLIRIDVFFWR